MIFKYILFYVFIALFGLLAVDFATVFFATITFFLGILLLFLTNKKNSFIKNIINIYQIIFATGFAYICICYLFMISNGYDYLLAQDIYGYFMPKTIEFLAHESITTAMAENWSGFNFFSRYHSGFFGYLIPFAYLSDFLSANLYVSMQFTTLLIASLSAAIVFKLLLVNNFETKRAFKYTIIICLFSVLFFYSTQLIRDIHVMFLYLLGIYLTFENKFSLSHLAKILLVILISCTLRIETGLFQFILVPIYLLLSMQQSRKKIAAMLVSVVFAIGGFFALIAYSSQVVSLLSDNSEIYLESDKGSGVVGNLQKIPVAGKVLSIVYNAVQPLPFWSKYKAGLSDNRPEMYNIMTFPLSFASLFNWITLFYIFAFLLSGKIRRKVSTYISKPLLYQLYIGFVFLYIQSAVIAQRRLMAYYVVYYILFYIIFTTVTKQTRQHLAFGAISSYSALQLFALFYKI
jgi:hypothetical protein